VQAKAASSSSGWFIGLIVAIAFLVLVLILVCIVKRNRGGKYAVYEREIAHGRLDYDEGGFREYSQPTDERPTPSGGEYVKPPHESDTDSMAEYGDDGNHKHTVSHTAPDSNYCSFVNRRQVHGGRLVHRSVRSEEEQGRPLDAALPRRYFRLDALALQQLFHRLPCLLTKPWVGGGDPGLALTIIFILS
jgi:hypothetical protein